MRVEVICVGTELLLGDIVNTNAATIGAALAGVGIDCFLQLAVGDNEDRIAEAIRRGLAEADALILSGGLGPTQDDVTREALSLATGRKLVRDERLADAVRDRFRRLKRKMPEINLRQADVPEGATPIEPERGTAPGLILEHGGRVVYVLPGVPSEMVEMLSRAVLPDLVRRTGGSAAISSRIVRVTGAAESAVAEALAPLWRDLEDGSVRMAFLAGGGEVRVRFTAKARTATEAAGFLDEAEAAVRKTLGSAVVGCDAETLEVVVLDLLTARGWTVACAESLTGGMLSARLTRVPGASGAFAGGVVAYSPQVKAAVIDVPGSVLGEHGMVSAECARFMAEGVRVRLDAGVGLSTTGVAGPDSIEGVPVGTVFVAVSGPIGNAVREVHLPGDRETVRAMATAAALNLLRLYLLEALP